MRGDLVDDPLVHVAHVGDRVESPARSDDEGVLGEQRRADDAPFVLDALEMRVGIEDEHFAELALRIDRWRERERRIGERD